MLCPSDYRERLVPRHAGWFPRLGQGALPRSRMSTTTLWVLPVLSSVCGERCLRLHTTTTAPPSPPRQQRSHLCQVASAAATVTSTWEPVRYAGGRGAVPWAADVPASFRPGAVGGAARPAAGAAGATAGSSTSGCSAACSVQTALAVCLTLMAWREAMDCCFARATVRALPPADTWRVVARASSSSNCIRGTTPGRD